MNFTDEELQMFECCFQIVGEGYRMSSDIETQLRRTFWWMSAARAYMMVRTWIRNREKIGALLAERSRQTALVENEQCQQQHGEACSASS